MRAGIGGSGEARRTLKGEMDCCASTEPGGERKGLESVSDFYSRRAFRRLRVA